MATDLTQFPSRSTRLQHEHAGRHERTSNRNHLGSNQGASGGFRLDIGTGEILGSRGLISSTGVGSGSGASDRDGHGGGGPEGLGLRETLSVGIDAEARGVVAGQRLLRQDLDGIVGGANQLVRGSP